MNKKVLILSSSPRKGGNSETLAAAFAKGALEAGNQVETVHLREKNYGFCRGCLACQKLGHCVIRDDAVEVTAKMHDADVLVFATPVYYYSVSGQLKTMLDRANPLYDTDYAFTKAYLLATAAEDEPDAERVDFRADMFRAYAEGFVEGTAGALTDREIAMLPDGAYIITLEQAIRFLTDYLEGDVYYHTAYADHNLVRTRTQIRMLMGMERDEVILRRAVAELRQHRAMHG